MRQTLARVRAGRDVPRPETCSATISRRSDSIELGTSAKMLSIVPLLAGGGFMPRPAPADPRRSTFSSSSRRTTFGGIRSASSWRWRCRLKTLATRQETGRPSPLPGPRPGQRAHPRERQVAAAEGWRLDNRGNHFYLAMCWAHWPNRPSTPVFAKTFAPIALATSNKTKAGSSASSTVSRASRGRCSYYHPDPADGAGDAPEPDVQRDYRCVCCGIFNTCPGLIMSGSVS